MATFGGDVRFDGARFEDDAQFGRARFEDNAQFSGATFKDGAMFFGATFEGQALFGGATFEGDARFGETTFKEGAAFSDGTFEGHAWFNGATFKGYAWFNGETFKGYAWFSTATFKGDAHFSTATFNSDTRFDKARFESGAGFDGARFESGAQFGEATFEGGAGFDGATFEGGVGFVGATFKHGARFVGAGFEDDAWFDEATFEGDVPVLGPVTVRGTLNLDGAQFALPVRIETDASALTCRRGRFLGGVRFDVRRALVRLDDADLSLPSLLTGPAVAASTPAGLTEQPKLRSLQRANIAGLALGNVDLASCRFAGAHNLDKLRLEANADFGLSPAQANWERRHVIAEESAWRAARRRPGCWKAPPWFDDEGQPEVLSPGALAGLYRALRKGREDAKDEPGAADFYYGEMEMRRHDRGKDDVNGGKSSGRVSRIVLTAYWLVSGYGLRAWRSLAALAVVMAGLAAAFRLVGFTRPTSYWKSLLFAFRSTIQLTDAQINLTAWGGLFQAILRLTGPVLLALTLLALRGRVKR